MFYGIVMYIVMFSKFVQLACNLVLYEILGASAGQGNWPLWGIPCADPRECSLRHLCPVAAAAARAVPVRMTLGPQRGAGGTSGATLPHWNLRSTTSADTRGCFILAQEYSTFYMSMVRALRFKVMRVAPAYFVS